MPLPPYPPSALAPAIPRPPSRPAPCHPPSALPPAIDPPPPQEMVDWLGLAAQHAFADQDAQPVQRVEQLLRTAGGLCRGGVYGITSPLGWSSYSGRPLPLPVPLPLPLRPLRQLCKQCWDPNALLCGDSCPVCSGGYGYSAGTPMPCCSPMPYCVATPAPTPAPVPHHRSCPYPCCC